MRLLAALVESTEPMLLIRKKKAITGRNRLVVMVAWNLPRQSTAMVLMEVRAEPASHVHRRKSSQRSKTCVSMVTIILH